MRYILICLLLVACTITPPPISYPPKHIPEFHIIPDVTLIFHNNDHKGRELVLMINGKTMNIHHNDVYVINEPRIVNKKYLVIWRRLDGKLISRQAFIIGPPTKIIKSYPFRLKMESDDAHTDLPRT
jgi:hypothetical protein